MPMSAIKAFATFLVAGLLLTLATHSFAVMVRVTDPFLPEIQLGTNAVSIQVFNRETTDRDVLRPVNWSASNHLPTMPELFKMAGTTPMTGKPDYLIGLMSPLYNFGDEFTVMTLNRSGNSITGFIRLIYARPTGDCSKSAYLLVDMHKLQPLPPGRYHVTIELREYLRNGNKIEPALLTAPRAFEHLTCEFTVPDDGIAAEMEKMALTSLAGKDAKDSLPDLSGMLKITGQQAELDDFKVLRQRGSDPVSGINNLATGQNEWALAFLLNDDDPLVRLAALRRLRSVPDPALVPWLLSIARRQQPAARTNEWLFQCLLKTCLENSTRLPLTPSGLKIQKQVDRTSTVEINSYDHPEEFPTQIDFTAIERWLRIVYLADIVIEAK